MNGGLKRNIPEDSNPESPSKLRKTIEKLSKENAQIKKKLQATRMKNIRLKRKVESLEGVVKELKRRNLVLEECGEYVCWYGEYVCWGAKRNHEANCFAKEKEKPWSLSL